MVVVLGALAAACTPHPVTPPPDATDSAAPSPGPIPPVGPTSCEAACVALALAGCPMGGDGSANMQCVGLMRQLDDGGAPRLNPATSRALSCADVATGVHTRADAQKLGFVCQ